MFQNNPLLAQLKQQIQASKEYVEGLVKASDKSYGFLECDKVSYFIPPLEMKKLMHGDKIRAVVVRDGDKIRVEADKLIEPMLGRFIAQVRFNHEGKLQLAVDHPNINLLIPATVNKKITQKLQLNDWVVAELKTHPLRDDRFFSAQITQFICLGEDNFAPWWVTLARHQQPKEAIEDAFNYELVDNMDRVDLTALHFITIDSPSTQDMDDALYIEPTYGNDGEPNGWLLVVAIADPTAFIPTDSKIEQFARERCFTNYLPAFNIPMLPRTLSDDICSLMPNQKRPALVGYIKTDLAGNVIKTIDFVLAWVESKAKLAYDNVSDWLENKAENWQPDSPQTMQQIEWLHQFTLARIEWRSQNALLFKEQVDYSFELSEDGKVIGIHAEYRRIANQIIEEAMILANMCAAEYLLENAKTGIFNTHAGFDSKNLETVKSFLLNTLVTDENQTMLAQRYSVENLSTLAGYCQMKRDIESFPEPFLEMRLRRYLTFAEFKTEALPHFGLGISHYATWTSPIRKYSDMVNHRVIKQCLAKETIMHIDETILVRLQEARKQNRMVERDIADWLYARYLAPMVEKNIEFDGVIQDIGRGGIRVKALINGASIFVPFSTLHPNKDEMHYNPEEIALYIGEKKAYQIGESVKVKLIDVRLESRSIIGHIC